MNRTTIPPSGNPAHNIDRKNIFKPEETRIIYIGPDKVASIKNTKTAKTEKQTYIVKIDVDLPEYAKNVNPTIPIHEYIAMLIEREHKFRLPDGTELVYNGYDRKGRILFMPPNGKTKRLSATLEYKYILYVKAIHTLALYLSTPTSLERACEFFNAPEHVITEIARSLEEPKSIVIDGEPQVVKWLEEKVLVVYMDGAIAGGKGVEVVLSGKVEAYVKGNERDQETIDIALDIVENIASSSSAEKILFVIDGNKTIANRIIERFDGRAIVVECSHKNWWEVCVIYKHNDEWYTLRLRADIFSETKKLWPDIDIPVDYVEVWCGILHVGETKRRMTIDRTVLRKLLERLVTDIPIGDIERVNLRALHFRLAHWARRVNTITQRLKAAKVDMEPYVSMLMNTVKGVCDAIGRRKGKYSKIRDIFFKALSYLSKTYRPVLEYASKRLRKSITSVEKKNVRARSWASKPTRVRRRRQSKKLIYYGPASHTPHHAKQVLDLLSMIFCGKNITSNAVEGRIGIVVRVVRGCRGNGKILLKIKFLKQPVADAFAFLSDSMVFGRGRRWGGPRFRIGGRYRIVYRDRRGVVSEREVTITGLGKRHVVGFCHLRGSVRTFRRNRILSVTPVAT